MKTVEELLRNGDTIEAFKSTFRTENGKKVLDTILILGGFFNDDINDPREVGKRNLCTTILKFMSVEEDGRSAEMVEAITDALVALPTNLNNKENKHE